MRLLSSLCLLFLLPLASAQQYAISTVAGIGLLPFGGEGGSALNAHLIAPRGVAADSAGNIFVSGQYYNQVFRISANGTITTYAGTGQLGFSGDGGPATATVDTAGNLYISQASANVIHMVRTDGTDTIIAGKGKAGFFGGLGQATAAQLFAPMGLKVDAAGNVFIADFGNNRSHKITPQGIISTVAGSAPAGYAGGILSSCSTGPERRAHRRCDPDRANRRRYRQPTRRHTLCSVVLVLGVYSFEIEEENLDVPCQKNSAAPVRSSFGVRSRSRYGAGNCE